ncbi:MAG: hypothetical protein OXM01_10195 [Gemmatimonadota bacterium]|nr:hypothetical protein [Gemmatimonadota bacterium]
MPEYEGIRLLAGQDDDTTPRHPNAKDRPVSPMQLGKEIVQVAGHAKGVPQQRQSRHLGNRLVLLLWSALARLQVLVNCDAARPAQEIQRLHCLDACAHPVELSWAQHLLEYAAGGGETDQVGLPRLGDLLVEENPHDAHLNLFRAVALHAGIALRVRHSRDQEEVVAGVPFQNAPLAQAVSGRIEYLRPQLQPYAANPVFGGVSLRVSRDQGQGGISDGIAQRRRIDKQKIGEIGVYAIMLSELQQRRGGKAEDQGPSFERMEIAQGVVLQEQAEVFGEGKGSRHVNPTRWCCTLSNGFRDTLAEAHCRGCVHPPRRYPNIIIT